MKQPTPHDPILHGASYVVFIKDSKVYLQRRQNTGFNDGKYNVPAGHMEFGERPVEAAIREAQEETGINLKEKDLELVQIMYRNSLPRIYADFFFVVSAWAGQPVIGEPNKCDADGWFDLEDMPELIPFLEIFFKNYKTGTTYSEFGWPNAK